MTANQSVQTISVIVPANPFVQPELKEVKHCLAALNVEKLIQWWPGKPHEPHRDAKKVKAIQRSLDWKRVAQIAAYLLQKEILDAPGELDGCFSEIYEPKKHEPGREWPPRVAKVVGFQRSEYPTFSNVLLHVNGARVDPIRSNESGSPKMNGEITGKLVFDEKSDHLNFSVIDGQHRINGAYFALYLLHKIKPNVNWQIPAEVFLDLDKPNDPPRRQAQVFIDVNFYQKKVDRSLVADLFPTARGTRTSLDIKERAQDLGRRLMLETGPLVGMIQIPGIRYGVKDVVTLATLNSAIEDTIEDLNSAAIEGLDAQAEFLANCLTAWLEATGRKHELSDGDKLDPENVAYQGRVIVSFLTLVPACIWKLRKKKVDIGSEKSIEILQAWLTDLMERAGLLDKGRFIPKGKFKTKGFHGSGGIARFRDVLWASIMDDKDVSGLSLSKIEDLANEHHAKVRRDLAHADKP